MKISREFDGVRSHFSNMRKQAAPGEFSAETVRRAIEGFLASARSPALIEPGERVMTIAPDRFVLEEHAGHLSLQAWDDERNLVRRVKGVARVERGKVSLQVLRFAGRAGELQLVDLAHPRTQDWERRGARMVFRERFRKMLERAFPGWRVSELSSEADLEHSLSPAYPRALLTRGGAAIAAIAAPPECADFPPLLSFGLIWLDYARRREAGCTVAMLAFWAPSLVAPSLSFYLPCFDPAAARFAMYLYTEDDSVMLLDPQNYGNVATLLDPCRSSDELPFAIEHAEAVPRNDGSVSLRVAGLEFARYENGRLRGTTLEEARANAAGLQALRHPGADRGSVIYSQMPEAWLEAVVRRNLTMIDASLRAAPLYGQVPAIAGANRTVLDLLAVDDTGRLAVIELKATQDLHLPLQALDYWLRVRWHLERGEFARFGYFPGIVLRREAPRLFLVAPSLAFHPTTESILKYLRPEIEVTRVGLGADWRENARVMFRLRGAERPHA